MKKLLLILFILTGMVSGYFEINDGVVTFYSDDGTRSWSMQPSLNATTIDWIWPDIKGGAGQTLTSDGTSTLIWGLGMPSSLTDGGILIGQGTDPIIALGVAAFGEIPIGDNDTGPVLATITGNTGIDVTNAAGSITLDFDSTELSALTWSDGTNASNIWTFNVSGTNHTMTAGSGLMTFSHAVTVDGAITGDSLTTTEFIVETDGDTYWTGVGTGLFYGNMDQEGSFTVTLTNQNQLYELDAATTNILAGPLNDISFDGDHYLEVNTDGTYFIVYSLISQIDSVAGGDQHVEFEILKNDVAIGKGETHASFKNITRDLTFGSNTIYSLSADDEISIGVTNVTSGGKTLTIDHLEMSISMVGGRTTVTDVLLLDDGASKLLLDDGSSFLLIRL